MKKTGRLDSILTRRGWVTDAQIANALETQRRTGGRFGSILVHMGFITETQLAEVLAEQYGTPKWDPLTAAVETAALRLFPEQWVRQKKFLPLAYDASRKTLEIAVTDPGNIALMDEIRFRAKVKSVIVVVAPDISLRRLWDRFYSTGRGTDSGTGLARQSQNQSDRLGIEFSFAIEAQPQREHELQPVARVLLWLSQPFVAKLLKSLLEVERCLVAHWDGESMPQKEWDYLIYDVDSAAGSPEAMARLKRACPKIQFVPKPAWTTSILRSPLSYEQLRDGYAHLAGYAGRLAKVATHDRRLPRYAHALARLLPMTAFEIDSLVVSCELVPLVSLTPRSDDEWESVAQELCCPYPVVEILRAAGKRFDSLGVKPGQSIPGAPLGARALTVLLAFLKSLEEQPVNSIESMGKLTERLHSDSGGRFDPLVVEALLSLVREEVLEGYLPPGPSEVMLVADRPIEWNHLVMQLENEGWRVVSAGGPAEARRLADRRRPDVVVWAASGALEWAHWQRKTLPGIANFLILDDPDTQLSRTALSAGFEDVWSGDWDAGIAAEKLRRAAARQPKATSKDGVVSGSLSQFSFIDLVQILSAGARTVRIDISNGVQTGQVVLWQGQIKYAHTEQRDGESAVYEMLIWSEGAFTMVPTDSPPDSNCRLSNNAMLLEGCRLIDERKRVAVTT